MKIFNNFIKSFLIHCLILSIFSSNCLANILENSDIVPNNKGNSNVSIDKAANGVAVVNINDPNTVGVSHNRFADFNVGSRGAIMNNSIVEGVSQIGGIVLANPNLRQSANTIINEITGSSRSSIAGAIEIFGGRADFILANPNGISINGAEFINTHKVTLTTGRPAFNNLGELENLIVTDGNIVINNRDLDIRNLDYFEIVSRSVRLNTKIHAGKEAKIVTGKNKYNFKTKQVESSSKVEETGLAVDSSALGGLYAGKITIVGTEKGMGVNLGDISSSSIDNLNITAEGKVTHRNITSNNSGINVNAKQGIEVADNSTAHASQGSINYNSNKNIIIGKKAKLQTIKAVNIRANDKIINNGKIITGSTEAISMEGASIDNNGIINAKNASVKLESKIGEIKNEGTIGAASDITIVSNLNVINKGKIISNQGGVTIVSNDDITNYNGQISSKLPLTLKANGQFNSQNSLIFSDSDICLEMNKHIINNNGEIKSTGKLNINSKEGNFINNYGKIIAGGSTDIIAGSNVINDHSYIMSGDRLKIYSGGLFKNDSGNIISNKSTEIKAAQDILNINDNIHSPDTGFIQSKDDIRFITKNGFINSGTILAQNGSGIIEAEQDITTSGLIMAQSGLNFNTHGKVDNQGILTSFEKLHIKADLGIINSQDQNEHKASIESAGKLEFTIANSGFTNRGNMTSYKNEIVIDSRDDIKNSGGKLESYSNMELRSREGNIRNENGIILSNKELAIEANGDITNLTTDMLNPGYIQSNQQLSIISNNGIITNSGNVLSLEGQILTTAKGAINNSGMIGSADDLHLTSSDSHLTNSGTIISNKQLKINTKDYISNVNGRIESIADTELKSREGNIINQDGAVIALKSLNIEAEGNISNITTDILNPGYIQSNQHLSIISNNGIITNSGNVLSLEGQALTTAKGAINNSGMIGSADDLHLTSLDSHLTNSGAITSNRQLKINTRADISNVNGKLECYSNMELRSREDNIINENGIILSDKELAIEANGDITNLTTDLLNPGYIQSNQQLNIISNSGTITNSGNILSLEGRVLTTSKGAINNSGMIGSADDLHLTSSDSHLTNSGTIISNKQLKINTKDDISNINGRLESIADTELRSREGNIINENGIILSNKELAIEANGDITNLTTDMLNPSYIQSNQQLSITSNNGSFTNSGFVLSVDDKLSVITKGDIDNSGVISSTKDVNFRSLEGSFTNNGGISTDRNLTIETKLDITNKNHALMLSVNKLAIKSHEGKFLNAGIIESKLDKAIFDINKSIRNTGIVQAISNKLKIISRAAGITNKGTLFASQGSELVAEGNIHNIGGKFSSDSEIKIKSFQGEIKNQDGAVIALKSLNIEAEGNISNITTDSLNPGYLTSIGQLNITSNDGSFTNSGNVLSLKNKVSLITKKEVINNGIVQGARGKELSINSNELHNKGQINSLGKMNLEIIGNIANDDGQITSVQNLNIKSLEGAFINTGEMPQDDEKFRSGVVFSEQDILINTKKGIQNIKGLIETSKNLSIVSDQGGVINDGIISAGKTDINVENTIINRGEIEGKQELKIKNILQTAKLENTGKIIADASGNIDIGGKIDNTGTITTKTSLDISADELENHNQITASGLDINVKNNIANKGTIQSEKLLELTADKLDNTGTINSIDSNANIRINKNVNNLGGIIKATEELFIESKNGELTNTGTIDSGKETELIIAKNINNSAAGVIKGGSTLSIRGGSLKNKDQAKIISGGAANINIDNNINNSVNATIGSKENLILISKNGELINTGKIISEQKAELVINNKIGNQGIIQSQEELKLVGAHHGLANIGSSARITSLKSDIMIDIKGEVNNTGTISNRGKLNLTTLGALSNSGGILAINDSVINSASVNNSGVIQSNNILTIQTNGKVINNTPGLISSGTDLKINAKAGLENKGQAKIKIQRNFGITTDAGYDNFGVVDIGGDFTLTGFTNKGKADYMNNQGSIKLNGPADISLKGDFTNNATMQNNHAISIAANNIQNTGTLSSGSNLTIDVNNAFTNNGILNTSIGTSGNIDIKAINIVNNGKLHANGLMVVNANSISNEGELISENWVNFTVSGLFNNSRQIQSRSDISINSGQFINSDVIKGQSLTVKSGSLTLKKGVLSGSNFVNISSNTGTTNKGILLSKNVVKANIANGDFINENLIVGSREVDIFAGKDLINKSNINSKGAIKMAANNNIENQANIVAGGALTLEAQKGGIINKKQLSSNGHLDLIANTNVTNNGLITSYSSARIKGKELVNHTTIQAKQNLELDFAGDLTNTGSNIYAGSLTLNTARDINNKQGRIITLSNLTIRSGGEILNIGGVISNIQDGTLAINSKNINNSRQAATKKTEVKPEQIYIIPAVPQEGLKLKRFSQRQRDKLQYLAPNKERTGRFEFDIAGTEQHTNQPYHKIDEAIYLEELQRTEEPNSIISSNGNIIINVVDTIDNTSGNIVASGGDIELNGIQLLNNDIVANEYIRKTTYHTLRLKHKRHGRKSKHTIDSWNDASIIEPQVIDRIPSLIQAKGAIIGSLSGSVNPGNRSPESGGGKDAIPYSQILKFENSTAILDEAEPATIYAAGGNSAASVNYQPLNVPTPVSLPAVDNTRIRPIAAPMPREQYNMADFSVIIPEPRAPGNVTPLKVPRIAPQALQQSNTFKDAAFAGKHQVDVANPLSPQDLFCSAIKPNSSVPLTISDISLSNEHIAQMAEMMARRSKAAYPDMGNSIVPNIDALLNDPELMESFENSYYTPPSAPGRYYITETSPVFTEFAKYHSTADFIERIPHFDPRKAYFHIGDALNQKLLIDNQIHKLTGLALLPEYQNGMDQIKRMYGSSQKFASDLDLTPGVRLSKDQLARLNEDIIWPEFMRMDSGEQALVPKVYLGKSATKEKFSGIIADEINITAATINNPTNIVGQSVELKAREGDITNKGLLLASKMMMLEAKGAVRNIGGHIESKGGLKVKGSGLVNERSVRNYDLGAGNFRQEADSEAKLISGGLFEGYISGDMVNIGSLIDVKAAKLEIEGDFIQEAVSVSENRKHGRDVSSKQSHIGSRFLVGGNLEGHIKGDLTMLGSTINLGGDNMLRVGGNTTIEDLVGFNHNEKVRSLRGKEVYNLDYQEHITEAGIIAKGKNVLITEGDVVIKGGRFEGSKGSSISGANISLLAMATRNQRAEEVKKGNILMDTHSGEGYSSKNIKATRISEGVSIKSKGEINIEIESGKMPGWVKRLEGQEGVNIKSLKAESSAYSYKTRTLTPVAQVVIATAITAATAGTGSFIGGSVASGIGASGAVAAGVSSAVAAGVSGFATNLVIGSANNGGNVLKGLKSATSKESMRSLGKSMLAAGIISGVTEGTGFGDVAKKAKESGVAGRNQAIFERVLLRTGVNSAVMGGKVQDNLKAESLRGLLAAGQGYVGDIAEQHGLREGGLAKVTMHSALGAGYALAVGGNAGVGALAGGMAEALSGLTSSASNAHLYPGTGSSGTGLSNWIDTSVAVASLLAGGSAADISTATTVSSSVVEYNQQLHERERELLTQMKQNSSEEEKILWDAAALSILRADEGVPTSDPYYAVIKELVELGNSDIAKQYREKLIALGKQEGWGSYAPKGVIARVSNIAMATENWGLTPVESYVPHPKPFEVTVEDKVEDFIAKQLDEVVTRSIGGLKVGAGGAGIGGAMTLSTTGIATPVAALFGTLSAGYAIDGYNQAFGDYQSTVGTNVLESLNGNVPSYLERRAGELGSEALIAAGGYGGYYGTIKTVGTIVSNAPKVLTQPLQIGGIIKDHAINGWKGFINPTRIVEKSLQEIQKTNIAKADKLNKGYTKAIDELTNIQTYLTKVINKESNKSVVNKVANTTVTPVETPVKMVVNADKFNKGPYDPRQMEKLLEANYPDKKVTSSTLPPANAPNVKLAGKSHPVSGVVYDQRGLPIFDKYVVYETILPKEIYKIEKSEIHMRAATRELREQIKAGKVNKNIFTAKQLQHIKEGKAVIDDLTWHHHQDIGRMQLMPFDKHDPTKHIGGMKLWFKE